MEVGSVDVYFPRVDLAIFNRDELELRRCQRRRVAIGRFGLRAASLELGHAHLHIGAEACLIVALRWRLCDRGLSGQDKRGGKEPHGRPGASISLRLPGQMSLTGLVQLS